MPEKTPDNSVCHPPEGGSNIFSAGIPFVVCLNLMREISDSLQKESAQTEPPGLRKHPKTVSVPPWGGARLGLRVGGIIFL